MSDEIVPIKLLQGVHFHLQKPLYILVRINMKSHFLSSDNHTFLLYNKTIFTALMYKHHLIFNFYFGYFPMNID